MLLCLCCCFITKITAQPYYIPVGVWLEGYDVGDNLCSECTLYDYGLILPIDAINGGSFGPDGELYVMSHGQDMPPWTATNDIWRIDIDNGNAATLIFDGPHDIDRPDGLAAVGGGIFYTVSWVSSNNDTLYRWDANTGEIEAVGSLGWQPWSDLWMAEGEMYYIAYKIGVDSERRIIRVDTINPANSEVMCSFDSQWGIFGLTATPISGLFIGTEIWTNNNGPSNVQIVTVNINDCSVTELCPIGGVEGAVTCSTSPYEHDLDPVTVVYIDLDCNDSSGATEADFNGEPVDCLDEEGEEINDIDTRIYIDAPIDVMTIEITNPLDMPGDQLVMTAGIPGIGVVGSGTTMITLNNSGAAKASEFIRALDQIRYINDAFYPTGGIRTIEVQFTTMIGTMSNVATAFIEVIELPQIEVDLGPDLEICDGQSTLLDAGNPGSTYAWSNDATTQTVMVSDEGTFSVIVSNSTMCPGEDNVNVDVIPVINVSLQGDTSACTDGSATLIIESDSPFPLTVEIEANPGGTFVIDDVGAHYEFTEYPVGVTEYVISNVTPSEPACIQLADNYQVIEIYPHYADSADVLLCDGDSILLGNTWIDDAGNYTVPYSSVHGCDSIVAYSVAINISNFLYYQSNTCNPAEAGVFITYLPNQAGCDTVVQTTISMLPADTTILHLLSCNSQSIGTFIESFANPPDCDSTVITNIMLIPPQDTAFHFISTCDSSAIGIFSQTLINHEGCDSLIITTISLSPADTTYAYGTSCNPASIGMFQSLSTNQSGCDSLSITTISEGIPDTTYLSYTSCDSSSLGSFEEHFISITECDSVVFTSISYSANDSTFISGSSCNENETGVFITNHMNRFGCDSIVTNTIDLLPASETLLFSSTCDPTSAGVFTNILINQFGCDSTITETISLNPTNHTFLSATTCDQATAGEFITTHLNQFGCDSLVTLTVSYLSPDTTQVFSFTCFENQIGHQEYFYTNQFGCDSLVIETMALYLLPEVSVVLTNDYNGYGVSCFGADDGHIAAEPSGQGPFEYIWSTGGIVDEVAGLKTGSYEVTVTDVNGCTASDVMELLGPMELLTSLSVNEPDCFNERVGVITMAASGGVSPFTYSLDGIQFQSSGTFNGLSEGTYTVTAKDANECEKKEIIWINVPLQVNVDLGADRTIMAYDSIVIEAIVNVPYDSLEGISWTGLYPEACEGCLTHVVAPIIATTYSVSITSIDGCKDEDQLAVFVEVNDEIYVPNIFSPNGDDVNDQLVVSVGSAVKEIRSLIIYDRWGNMVFEANHFHPDDNSGAWDGRLRGQDLNPAVFAYRMIAVLRDGREIVLYGDVTLLK